MESVAPAAFECESVLPVSDSFFLRVFQADSFGGCGFAAGVTGAGDFASGALPVITSEEFSRALRSVAEAYEAPTNNSNNTSACVPSAASAGAVADTPAGPMDRAFSFDMDQLQEMITDSGLTMDDFKHSKAVVDVGQYAEDTEEGSQGDVPEDEEEEECDETSSVTSSSFLGGSGASSVKRPGKKVALQFEDWPEEIVKLPLKQLNAYIKANKLTKAMAKDLKRVRRRMQNKRAAQDGRLKKAAEKILLGEAHNSSTKEQLKRLQLENAKLEREVSRLVEIIKACCPEQAAGVFGSGAASTPSQPRASAIATALPQF